ncbi:hypothetical protein BGZ46_009209, partial [Entomortierella lignicola]
TIERRLILLNIFHVPSNIAPEGQTFISIPIIDGVAQPVQRTDFEKTSNNGQRFELDHKVPSADEIARLYRKEGRHLFGHSSDDDSIVKRDIPILAIAPDPKAQNQGSEISPDSLPLTSSSESASSDKDSVKLGKNKDTNAKSELKESIYSNSIETLESTLKKIFDADIDSIIEDTPLMVVETMDSEDAVGANDKEVEPIQQSVDNESSTQETTVESNQNKDVTEKNPQDQEKEQTADFEDTMNNIKEVKTKEGDIVVINKLNKNYESFDEENDDQKPLQLQSQTSKLNFNKASWGDRTRNRLLGHHFYHHINHEQSSPEHQQPQQGQRQPSQQVFSLEDKAINDPSLRNVVFVDENPYIFTAIDHQRQYLGAQWTLPEDADTLYASSDLAGSNTIFERADQEDDGEGVDVETITTQEDSDYDDDDNDDLSDEQDSIISDEDTKILAESVSMSATSKMPESLRNRGLVPSVMGAHHCTPRFCVNVSLSDDGKFATFHVERPLAETGWISLGIGYAMTMADLIVLWPNPTTENGGGPRGAVLSRRSSHAYVEPQPVGRRGHGPLDNNIREAGLYPPNEYVLHNSNPGAAITAASIFPDNSKFIVQFTRPVLTKNREHKLTPGEEQDFCWAYSPKPVSADSVADPGAHITQHLSVGSFSMDVGANQPRLKKILSTLKPEDDETETGETEDKKKNDTNNSVHNIHGKHTSKQHQAEEGIKKSIGSERPETLSLKLQAFTCLVTVSIMLFLR